MAGRSRPMLACGGFGRVVAYEQGRIVRSKIQEIFRTSGTKPSIRIPSMVLVVSAGLLTMIISVFFWAPAHRASIQKTAMGAFFRTVPPLFQWWKADRITLSSIYCIRLGRKCKKKASAEGRLTAKLRFLRLGRTVLYWLGLGAST
jgi:hypothetical protein